MAKSVPLCSVTLVGLLFIRFFDYVWRRSWRRCQSLVVRKPRSDNHPPRDANFIHFFFSFCSKRRHGLTHFKLSKKVCPSTQLRQAQSSLPSLVLLEEYHNGSTHFRWPKYEARALNRIGKPFSYAFFRFSLEKADTEQPTLHGQKKLSGRLLTTGQPFYVFCWFRFKRIATESQISYVQKSVPGHLIIATEWLRMYFLLI